MRPNIVYFILLANALGSFSILLLPSMERRRQWCLCFSCMVLPVFGLLGMVFVFLFRTVFGNQEIDKEGLSVKLPGLDYISDVNFEKEVNVVPVEEALLVNPNMTKRQIVMEAIKHNPADYLISLKKALYTEDSETAHYAATGITDVKRVLERRVVAAAEEYQKDTDNRMAINRYIDALNLMIESKLTVEIMHRQYQLTLVSILKSLIESGVIVETEKYELLIEALVNLGLMKEALKWAKEFVNAHPKKEKPLVYLLDLAYTQKDKYLFYDTLNELKHADFDTSTNTREMITYWEQSNEK